MNDKLVQLGDFTLDLSDRKLTSPSCQETTLNWKNLSVLMQLVDNQKQIVTREQLINEVWEGNFLVGDKAISTAIWNLRKIFEGSSVKIDTVPKKGYLLSIAPQEEQLIITAEKSILNEELSTSIWKLSAAVTAVLFSILFIWFGLQQYREQPNTGVKAKKIALLTRVIGNNKSAVAEKFIENIEEAIQSSSGLTLISNKEKAALLGSQEHLTPAKKLEIESILYLIINVTNGESITMDVRLQSVSNSSFQTTSWQTTIEELASLENEVVTMLLARKWQ